MSEFASFVATHEDALLARWASGVEHGNGAGSAASPRSHDRVETVRSLIAALRRGSSLDDGRAPASDVPELPPPRSGSDVQTVVREYGVLVGALLDLAEDSGATLSIADMRVVTTFMTAAVADRVAAHAPLRADLDRIAETASPPGSGGPPHADPSSARAHARSQGDRDVRELDRLLGLFMDAPMLVYVLDGPRLTYTFANDAYRATVAGRELVGKPLVDALPELRGQGFDTLLAGVMASGTPLFGNEVAVHIANATPAETRYYNFVYQPRRDLDGVVSGVLVVGNDVTAQVEARKRLEAESAPVRANEDRLRRLIEASGAGAFELDTVARVITTDAATRALHGFPPDSRLDLNAAVGHVHPDDQPAIGAALNAALDPKGSGHYHAEYRIGDAVGHVRWIEARGRAQLDASGVATKLLGTCVDVTARKTAELGREGLLEALAAQPFLQVCVLEGPEHVVTLANAEYRANVAGGRDLVGMPVLAAFPELSGQGFDALMAQVLETGVPYIGREVSTCLDRGNGIFEERFFNFALQPVRGALGTFDTLLNLSHDVTHFVESRRALEATAAQERARADFERQLIGIVSHDLRNPLSVLGLGVAQLLHYEQLEPTGLKAVLRIQNTLEHMVRLVNDLLDFTQVRLGSGLPMVRAPMNLHQVVRQVVEELRMTTPDRDIELEMEGDGRGVWDAARLAQAAMNLISNALKYSPRHTTVRVSTRAVADRVELRISNPGTPIDPDALPRLFEPMQRGSAHTDPTGRSVGLGLFIVKHIVDALGGTIAVVSTASDGTTFTLSLPRTGA